MLAGLVEKFIDLFAGAIRSMLLGAIVDVWP